jgi:chromosome segregation ATPase
MIQKLDSTHLSRIQHIRQQYDEITVTLGRLTIEHKILQEKQQEIEHEITRQYDILKQTQTQEDALIAEMRERYGEGQINIADGTFISDDGLGA